MPEPLWLRALARLLPAHTRHDLFAPSCQDLRIFNLSRGRPALSPWPVLLVFLQCWFAILSDAFSPPAAVAPGERLSQFWYLVRHALRLLRREPGFTAAAILTLAMGIGANVAIFALVEAVLLRPFPYADAGRLVILNHRDRRTGITKEFIAIGDYVDLVQRQSVFQSIASYGDFGRTVFGMGEPFRVSGIGVDPAFFATMALSPSLGRTLRAEDSRPGAAKVAVLGYDFWQSRFGSDPTVIGRALRLDNTDFQIVGVGPPGFRFPPGSRTEVILPATIPLQAPPGRKNGWTFAIARLKPGVDPSAANANLTAISRQFEREFPRTNLDSEYFALPLRDAVVGNTKPALILMLAAVSLVLLIACANVANLLLARSLSRRREMALRAALGAGRSRLLAQLLVESLVLALLATSAGTLVAQWGARFLVTMVPRSVNIPRLADVRINGAVLAFAIAIAVLTTLVFGMVSALTVRTGHTGAELVAAGRVSLGPRARRSASALVIIEVALAIVLLIGAGLIFRSFSRLLNVDPGFRGDRVLTVDVQFPAGRYREAQARFALFQQVFRALKSTPGIEEAGAAAVTPLTGNNWTVPLERADRPAPPGERPPEVGWQMASGGYFRAMRIPLLAGRLFNDGDAPGGAPAIIVSEAIERRYFPGERALGRELKLADVRYEIVGVVGNIRRAGLRDEPRADLYFPFERAPSNQITLFIAAAADPARLLPAVQAALRSVDPGVAVIEAQTMAAVAGESMQVTHLALWLLGAFAVIALVLAAVGIYGVMSYVVRQRTREIGTRVALGATRADIAWLVMRQGVEIAGIGTTLGLAAGFPAARALRGILYGISPSDPLTVALAAAVLAVTTMAACYLPARRAARLNPARTLGDQ